MIDISSAQLEPFCGFHRFHEEVNVYLKVTLSAALLLVRYASAEDEIADLIKLTHPSWNNPPVRSMSIALQRGTHDWISSFALVAVFSAFDDFLTGTEAELHRFQNRVGSLGHGDDQRPEGDAGDGGANSDDADAKAEHRLLGLYLRTGWATHSIQPYLKAVRYFRICRNCIAHRNGRASQALVDLGKDDDLHAGLSLLHDRASTGLRSYELNDRIHVEPTQAILCSHLLREIAVDANRRLISMLGLDGFLRSVAHHTMFGDAIVRTPAHRAPEAVLNYALTDRYRARVDDRLDSIQEMKRIGLWKEYIATFDRKYANAE